MGETLFLMQNFLKHIGYDYVKIADNEKRIYLLNVKSTNDEFQISEKASELGLVFVKEQKPYYKPIEPLSNKPPEIDGFIKSYYIEER